ncbi:hypothetical protein E4T39_02229 [Aureobasidium subglaciale]|nr:hypothetical protein E4T39_02229 [Aureobasidium subglaciale]
MRTSSRVIDDTEGDVMDIALGSLRARQTPMLKVEGLSWILDENLRPAIVAGYGTDDPEKMSSIHHIIKFHVRRVPIFNVVSAMVDYAVKHTRVATPNVIIFDGKIPAQDIKTARDYLAHQYTAYVLDVAEAFRSRGLKVPPVDEFEQVPAAKGKGKGHKIVTKHRTTKTFLKARVAKKARNLKAKKHVRFTVDEDDDDGPVRRLTPTRKEVTATLCADGKNVQSSSERADSLMDDTTPNHFVYKRTAEGLALVFGPDAPVNSVEGCLGLSSATSMIEAASDVDMSGQNNWSFGSDNKSILDDQRGACAAQEDLFVPG